MRHRISKGLQFPVRHLKLEGTQQHPRFEIGVQAEDFLLLLPALGDVALDRHPMGELAGLAGDGRYVGFQPAFPAVLGVDHNFRAHRLPPGHGGTNPVQLGLLGVRSPEKRGGMAQRFGAAVAGLALKGIVDKNNARAALFQGYGFGDDDDVVQARHRRLQQPQLRLFRAPLGDVLKVNRQPVFHGIDMEINAQVQRRVKSFKPRRARLLDSQAAFALHARAQGLGKFLPEGSSQNVFPPAPEHALGLAVKKGELPVLVDQAKAVGDAFQGGGEL